MAIAIPFLLVKEKFSDYCFEYNRAVLFCISSIRTGFASRTVATFSPGEDFFKVSQAPSVTASRDTFLPEEGFLYPFFRLRR